MSETFAPAPLKTLSLDQAVLDQWKASATQDLESGEPWSAHPEAVLMLLKDVAEMRVELASTKDLLTATRGALGLAQSNLEAAQRELAEARAK